MKAANWQLDKKTSVFTTRLDACSASVTLDCFRMDTLSGGGLSLVYIMDNSLAESGELKLEILDIDAYYPLEMFSI